MALDILDSISFAVQAVATVVIAVAVCVALYNNRERE